MKIWFIFRVLISARIAAGHTCRNEASFLGGVAVEHCWHDMSGYFVLSGQAVTLGARFVGRIVGPGIKELIFNRNGSAAVSRYNLPRGTYSAAVEMRYEHFDPEAFNLTQAQWLVVFKATFSVPASLCPQSVSKLDGYWEGESSNTLSPAFLFGAQAVEAARHENLSYAFERCRLMDDNDIRRCVHGTPPLVVCVIGDSQARHASDALIHYIQAKHPFLEGNLTSTQTDKHVPVGTFIHFVDDVWGNWTRWATLAEVQSCNAILFNFGQWPAGWPMGYAWPVSRYGTAVRAAALGARATLPSKRLVWLTNHPNGHADRMATSPPDEWRTDVVLREYNEAAVKELESINFEYIDVFRIANVLHDLTYDGSHFKVPIEREVARIIFHSLCA
jgi:hypothetical protein